jgi:hypothetical protein
MLAATMCLLHEALAGRTSCTASRLGGTIAGPIDEVDGDLAIELGVVCGVDHSYTALPHPPQHDEAAHPERLERRPEQCEYQIVIDLGVGAASSSRGRVSRGSFMGSRGSIEQFAHATALRY